MRDGVGGLGLVAAGVGVENKGEEGGRRLSTCRRTASFFLERSRIN
jgi:hypothetical protein